MNRTGNDLAIWFIIGSQKDLGFNQLVLYCRSHCFPNTIPMTVSTF